VRSFVAVTAGMLSGVPRTYFLPGRVGRMSESDRGQPSDTMRERVDESRVKLWVLLGANRWVLTGLLVGGLFVALVFLGTIDPAPLRSAMGSKDPVETTFQGFLTAIITGVTLVVTLNQLVLSQELGAVGDQRERMEEAMAFRRDVEGAIDSPAAPPEPAAFLRAIVDATAASADRLAALVGENGNDELRERTTNLVDSIRGNADAVDDRLEGAEFGTFEVLFAALNYNYSWKLYEARRLRNRHADALSEEAQAAFDELTEALRFFGPAREHFKTLYFQWELVNLSRVILYAAVPALLVSVSMILFVGNPDTISGATFAVDNLVWVTSAAVAVALLPFVLLLSYVLRIATVAKRTLAMGPFVLRASERTGDEWGR
jgi:hypothetical protein